MLGSFATRGSFSSAQGAHPLHGPCDRSFQAPADDQQSSDCDQKDFHHQAQKCSIPEAPALNADVAGIMDDHQSAGKVLVGMQRDLIDFNVVGVDPTELSAALAVYSRGRK